MRRKNETFTQLVVGFFMVTLMALLAAQVFACVVLAEGKPEKNAADMIDLYDEISRAGGKYGKYYGKYYGNYYGKEE